jgi:hypothetical protein
MKAKNVIDEAFEPLDSWTQAERDSVFGPDSEVYDPVADTVAKTSSAQEIIRKIDLLRKKLMQTPEGSEEENHIRRSIEKLKKYLPIKSPDYHPFYAAEAAEQQQDRKRKVRKCQCTDPGCPVCKGKCANRAVTAVIRSDMDDKTGTPMCRRCADDAMESGLFREEPWKLRFYTAEASGWFRTSRSKARLSEADNRKIDIFVNGEYKASTTWSKSCKEAKDKYLRSTLMSPRKT